MNTSLTPLTFPATNAASPFQDVKAGHIAIRTTAYDALVNWYQEKLDFRLVREWTAGEMKLAFLALPNDNTFLLEILGVSGAEAANTDVQPGYDHLCLNVADLDHTLETLKQRGIPVVRSFRTPAIGKRVAFIADLLGNKIEFCADLTE